MMPAREAGYHFLFELVDHDTAPMRQEVSNLLAALKPDGVILTPQVRTTTSFWNCCKRRARHMCGWGRNEPRGAVCGCGSMTGPRRAA